MIRTGFGRTLLVRPPAPAYQKPICFLSEKLMLSRSATRLKSVYGFCVLMREHWIGGMVPLVLCV